jgi:hypothetical protein
MHINPFSDKKIDLTKIPDTYPSLCIPRVFNGITEELIKKVLNELKFGIIEKIDIIEKKNQKEENFKCVFIHFKKWNTIDTINATREKLLSGKDVKIMYDEPWFWKVSAYRAKNTVNINFKNNIFKNNIVYTNPNPLLWVIRTPSCSPPRRRNVQIDNNLQIDNNVEEKIV